MQKNPRHHARRTCKLTLHLARRAVFRAKSVAGQLPLGSRRFRAGVLKSNRIE